MKPWHSLFRNRRGGVCAVCVGLLFTLAVILGTWSARCFLDHRLLPLPDGTVPLLATLTGCKFFQYRDDARADACAPPAAADSGSVAR